MRYWTQISENEKRGHSNTSQGNPKGCSLEDRRDVYILTNMHALPVEGTFTQESGQAIKPRVVEDYTAYMGFVDKSDRMVIAMELPAEHGSGPRNCFSTLQT